MEKRIRFEKLGVLKFIGHLDIMRTFQRAFRRAGVPLAYSQGFNPHPLLAFANPLGLGITSEDEYAEITLESPMENEEIVERMNRELPMGIRVLGCYDMPDHGPSAMAQVAASEYIITLPEWDGDWPAAMQAFMNQPQILLRKLGKKHGRKQWVEIDCKPLIYEYEMLDARRMRLLCACGSTLNLKTDAMLESLYQWMEKPQWQFEEQIHRTHLYQIVDGKYMPLAGEVDA